MDDELSRFAEYIQEEINKGFSHVAIEHAMNPRNVGRVDGENGFASYTGTCGDTMTISIRVSGGRIVEAMFYTDGCGASIASGSMVTELARGRTLEEAAGIDQTEVLDELGGLPEENEHCALLAATALHMAIETFVKSIERDKLL
ncbi:MAG: iron-sulfur cluster assembly scaffold protein [Actinomycetota bacterium]|nr:iron-sulfur cluster assembly scaffold protein [Actinomycetota bacterium]